MRDTVRIKINFEGIQLKCQKGMVDKVMERVVDAWWNNYTCLQLITSTMVNTYITILSKKSSCDIDIVSNQIIKSYLTLPKTMITSFSDQAFCKKLLKMQLIWVFEGSYITESSTWMATKVEGWHKWCL